MLLWACGRSCLARSCCPARRNPVEWTPSPARSLSITRGAVPSGEALRPRVVRAPLHGHRARSRQVARSQRNAADRRLAGKLLYLGRSNRLSRRRRRARSEPPAN